MKDVSIWQDESKDSLKGGAALKKWIKEWIKLIFNKITKSNI